MSNKKRISRKIKSLKSRGDDLHPKKITGVVFGLLSVGIEAKDMADSFSYLAKNITSLGAGTIDIDWDLPKLKRKPISLEISKFEFTPELSK